MDVNQIYIVVFAFGLDVLLGDPRKLPHLIVGYGTSIAFGEKWLNKGSYKFLKGASLTILLVSISYTLPYLIITSLNAYDFKIFALAFSILMLFSFGFLENKSVMFVFNAIVWLENNVSFSKGA